MLISCCILLQLYQFLEVRGDKMDQKKQVLVLCTGNSCRSIMAEAMINAKLGDCIEAQSSGVKASGRVNPHAQALLESKGEWRKGYHSKVIETVLDTPFDLVVTVCDAAKETCPTFPRAVKRLHIGFEDPSGKAVEEYAKTYDEIEKTLLPILKKELCSKDS
jgi:arsenate reductase